ncbi:VQ motif-containing protein 20 [Syzygium oleosum]|uniref:VQ motif-containing protein 20 n=1 Tax=Syzygium oleosum TaxID=219896 RepID=UPI0011D1874A|nr:VQ motif-containing protein 20 [Syzygium oleosum]
MSPAHFNDHHHAPLFPPPLKTNRDSRSIKKPSPSSSSSSSSTTAAAAPLLASAPAPASASAAAPRPSQQQQQQRHPVIIYTHSPKIIHTQPRDFMALVQKLTGISRSSPDDDPKPPPPPPPPPAEAFANSGDEAEAKTSKAGGGGEDNECSSVITEENCSSSVGDGGQVNSCFAVAAPGFEAANGNGSYLSSHLPFVPPNNAADFLCSNQPGFYDFSEATAFGFPASNVRTSYNVSSYSSFERTNNFREF